MLRRIWFDLDRHLQRKNRVEREAGRRGGRPHGTNRLAIRVSSPDKSGPVGLEALEPNVGIVCEEPVEHDRRAFMRTPWLARKEDAVELRDELAMDEQLAEGRVTFVIRRSRQY